MTDKKREGVKIPSSENIKMLINAVHILMENLL